jgi:cytochrome P450
VNELLRLIPPGTVTYRYPIEDTSLHGKSLKRGDVVVVNYVYANRDASVWEAPHELRPRRQPNPHLSFSAGPHTCAGAQLGLAETVAGISWFVPSFAALSAMDFSPQPPKYSLRPTWSTASAPDAARVVAEGEHQTAVCPHHVSATAR